MTLGFALRAGTPMSYLALEANAEAAKKQKRYNLKLTGRAMFLANRGAPGLQGRT